MKKPTAGSQIWNFPIPNLLLGRLSFFELLVLMESKNFTTNHLPPLVLLLSKTPKEQRLWLRFSSATWVLKSFMFGSTMSPKMVSMKGWFSMIFWLLGGHMFHSTCLPKNGTTCYPTIKSIAQQPLIFELKCRFFPGSVDPTL